MIRNSFHFFNIMRALIFSSTFILITMIGNIIIISFSFAFHYLEADVNPGINEFIDAIWWAYATGTTVGYGDVVPMTVMGKIVGVGLMLSGTALFATYTALFAQTILEDELLRRNLKRLKGKEE